MGRALLHDRAPRVGGLLEECQAVVSVGDRELDYLGRNVGKVANSAAPF